MASLLYSTKQNMTSLLNKLGVCSVRARGALTPVGALRGSALRVGEGRWLAPLLPPVCVQATRSKHWDIKWRKLRAAKVLKIDLPDFEKLRREANMSPDEMRAEMKRKGYLPPRTHQERGIIIASTNSIFEPYVPPEGDGLASPVSGQGAMQRVTELEKKGRSMMQVRKIRQFEESFDTKEFAQLALDVYIEAHQLLQDIKKNEDRLHELITEKAYPEMTWKMDARTVRWTYVEALEPPRVVHARTTEMMSKENLYAQVTVRLLTKQLLAVYDRFGRLMYGSESLAKDCLEYVVMEKHLADEYGTWRIHGKVVPDWLPPALPVRRTMRQPNFDPLTTDEEGGPGGGGEEKGGETQGEGEGGSKPLVVATA